MLACVATIGCPEYLKESNEFKQRLEDFQAEIKGVKKKSGD